MHRVAALFVIVAAFSACGDLEKKSQLDSARSLWKEQKLESYVFEYSQLCLCFPPNQLYVVTVRNGVVSEVKRGDTGEVISTGEYDPIPTVPELFDELERAFWIADGWSATYDPDAGYPQSASFNWTSVIDDEITRYVSNLTELP